MTDDLLAPNQPFYSSERVEQRLREEIERLRAEVAAYKAECRLLKHKVIACGVAASHPNAGLAKTGHYAKEWDSQQAHEVRALRDRADASESELAALRKRVEDAPTAAFAMDRSKIVLCDLSENAVPIVVLAARPNGKRVRLVVEDGK